MLQDNRSTRKGSGSGWQRQGCFGATKMGKEGIQMKLDIIRWYSCKNGRKWCGKGISDESDAPFPSTVRHTMCQLAKRIWSKEGPEKGWERILGKNVCKHFTTRWKNRSRYCPFFQKLLTDWQPTFEVEIIKWSVVRRCSQRNDALSDVVHFCWWESSDRLMDIATLNSQHSMTKTKKEKAAVLRV